MSISEEEYKGLQKYYKQAEYEFKLRQIMRVCHAYALKEPFIDDRFTEEQKSKFYVNDDESVYYPYGAVILIPGNPLNYKYYLN